MFFRRAALDEIVTAIKSLSTQFLKEEEYLPRSSFGVIDSKTFYAKHKNHLPKLVRRCRDQTLYNYFDSNPSIPGRAVIAAALAAAYLEHRQYDLASRFVHLSLAANHRDQFAMDLDTLIIEARNPPEETIADYLKRSWCNRPFAHLETSERGDCYTCCPHWVTRPIGDLNKQTWREVWNSKAANEIRESIKDGSFRYCSTNYCPYIVSRGLPSRDDPTNIKQTPEAPDYVALSHDPSCNLSCPSCRTHIRMASKEDQAKLDVAEENIADMVVLADKVQVTGSGDPFASNHFRRLIKRVTAEPRDKRKLWLITNAQLCDQRGWNDLSLDGHVRQLAVSVDAATEETYKIVRRPGDFKRLLTNLDFIAHKRCEGEIGTFCLYFVVSAINFREMDDFVRLGKSLGADVVQFTRIRNWGSYSADDFKKIDIFDPHHPDYSQLVEAMKSPLLHQKPVIDLPVNF